MTVVFADPTLMPDNACDLTICNFLINPNNFIKLSNTSTEPHLPKPV